jgi:hypothetical protein
MKKTKINNLWWYFKNILKNDYASQLVISDLKEDRRKKEKIEDYIKQEKQKDKITNNKNRNQEIINKYLTLEQEKKESLLLDFYKNNIKWSIIYEKYWKKTNIEDIIYNKKILPIFRNYISKNI